MINAVINHITGHTYKNKYRIGKKVFVGSFAEVFNAESRNDGTEAVVKVLTEAGEKIASKLKNDPKSMWEGEILLALKHPNIVKGYDCSSGKKFWIAMEKLDFPLNTYLSCNFHTMTLPQKVEILYNIAKAIRYLHNKGLVHRDIATDNIMLKDNTAKLIDFGMTAPLGSDVIKGRVGTPSYMAPEMIRRRESTSSGDIYSFGMVMYELITGVKPFTGESKEQRMTQALNMAPLAPSVMGRECPKDLEMLIMGCISKDPYQRPGNAQKVVRILENIREQEQ